MLPSSFLHRTAWLSEMADDPVYFLLKGPDFPLGSEADHMLGRFVKSYGNPFKAYVPKDALIFNTEPVRTSSLTDFESIVQSTDHKSLLARLFAIFGFSAKSDNDTKIDLSGKQLRAKRLQQYEDMFERMVEDDEVSERLKKWLIPGGRPAFMIVSVLLWKDATLATESHSSTHISADAEIHLKDLSAAAGIPHPINPGKVAITSSNEHSADTSMKGDSKGWHVFAVEYRCVRRKLLSGFGDFKLEDQPRYTDGRTFGEPDDEHLTSQEEDVSVAFQVDDEDTDWFQSLDDPEEEDGIAGTIEQLPGISFVF